MSKADTDDWELRAPSWSTGGLRALLTTTSEVLRSSAAMVASGDTSEPPDMMAQLRKHNLLDHESKSELAKNYDKRVDEINEIKKAMHKGDGDVKNYSADTFDTSSKTYVEIKETKTHLQETIDAQPAPAKDSLVAAAEAPLIRAALHAGVAAHELVASAQKDMGEQAAKIAAAERKYQTMGGRSGPVGGGPTATLPPVPPSSMANPWVGPPTVQDYAPYTGSATVNEAIEGALDALGITDPHARALWKQGYLVLIERESSNNPNARNGWDRNAAAGNASVGLCQVIPTTFNANHVAGTSTNPYDPVANVAASMNYVMNRYGVLRDGSNLAAEVDQANPLAAAKGY